MRVIRKKKYVFSLLAILLLTVLSAVNVFAARGGNLSAGDVCDFLGVGSADCGDCAGPDY